MIMDIKDNIYNFNIVKVNSFYDGDWKDAVIQMENPIYLKKSYYPFGEIYFRARTMDKEELAKIPGSRQYEYSYELSPWSYSLYAFNNIYNSDGISLTKNNIIVELNFIFNASYTGYLWEKDLSNFAASIKYGDKNLTYTVKDKYYKNQAIEKHILFQWIKPILIIMGVVYQLPTVLQEGIIYPLTLCYSLYPLVPQMK